MRSFASIARANRFASAAAITLALGGVPSFDAVAADAADAAAPSKTVQLLQKLLAFDTSNPPGNTKALAEFLKAQFEPLGVETDVIPTPGQAVHFIARVKGDGSKRPVLLAGHSDVVPVERQLWTVDPFAGVVKDGFVLGRGAMDFKGGLAVFARAIMMLVENKIPLARDVILLAEADEEAGNHGTEWLAANHWDKIDAEFALNEGGWILEGKNGEAQQINITTTEKLSLTLELTTHGTPTHSSRPPLDNAETAVGRLAKALAKLADHETAPHLNDQTRAYFRALSESGQEPLAGHLRTLVESNDPQALREAGEKSVELGAYPLLWHALMRNTISLTIIQGGIKNNVIPGMAQATINIRAIPGVKFEAIVEELRKVIDDSKVGISAPGYKSLDDARASFDGRTVAPPSSTGTDLYRALTGTGKRIWPKAEVVPAVFEAGTDASAWRKRGIPVYGIYPYPLDNETLLRMHGNDERVGVRSLDQGTGWVYETLVEVAGKK